MKNEKNFKKWLFWFTFALASIMVYKFLDNFSTITNFIGNFISVIKPFLIAVFIAYLLYLPCKKIEETLATSKIPIFAKHRRGISVLLVYLILAIVIFIIINFIWPSAVNSVTDLVNNLPSWYNRFIYYFASAKEGTWQYDVNNSELMAQIKEFNVTETIKNIFVGGQITEYIARIMGAASTVFDIFVTLVVSIYVLAERHDILHFCKNVCKASLNDESYNKVKKYYRNTNTIFAQFITGQLLDAFIVGLAMSIILTMMEIRYSIVLGFMIGFMNLIPYFGAIIGSIIAGIITIFTGGLSQVIWLEIWALVIQQIDGNIINPRILGNKLSVSPILVIFSVTVGGAYFGPLGMFLGVPTIALIKLILNDVIDEKIEAKEAIAAKENSKTSEDTASKTVKSRVVKNEQTGKSSVIKVNRNSSKKATKRTTKTASKTAK